MQSPAAGPRGRRGFRDRVEKGRHGPAGMGTRPKGGESREPFVPQCPVLPRFFSFLCFSSVAAGLAAFFSRARSFPRVRPVSVVSLLGRGPPLVQSFGVFSVVPGLGGGRGAGRPLPCQRSCWLVVGAQVVVDLMFLPLPGGEG